MKRTLKARKMFPRRDRWAWAGSPWTGSGLEEQSYTGMEKHAGCLDPSWTTVAWQPLWAQGTQRSLLRAEDVEKLLPGCEEGLATRDGG